MRFYHDSKASLTSTGFFVATSRRWVGSILKHGLKAKERQFVHLSKTIEAGKAYADGITFYRATGLIYLAPYIPPAYIASKG